MADISFITERDKLSPISEAYRAIRTNLQFAGADKAIKTVVFTSAIPSEGKSTTDINLAIVMGQDHKRVLLIDADLRGPRVHRLFGIDQGRGVSEILSRILSEIIIKRTSYENLFVLTAGNAAPNVEDLLASGQLKKIIQLLSREFDVILLDAPSVHTASDAAIIGQQVDGCVLVARRGYSKKEPVEQAIAILQDAGVKIVGTIIASYDSDSSRVKKTAGKKGESK